ncbi:MAG: flagellar hook-length control protein FliK [Smithella sp.]
MEISAGKTADVSPEINIGKLLQMVKKSGLDKKDGLEKSPSIEKKADGIGSDAENGTDFLQVLQKKLAALMQSDHKEGSPELAETQELSAALEKLLQEDQTSAGEILSGLALLANAGKMEGSPAGENELSEESLSALTAAKGITGILKAKIDGPVDQAKQAMVENGKGISVSQNVTLAVDEKGSQQDIITELNAKDAPKEAQLQNQADASFKGIHAGAIPGYVEAERKASGEGQKPAQNFQSVKDNSVRQTSPTAHQLMPEGQTHQAVHTENGEDLQNGYGDVQKKATAALNDKASKFINAEQNASTEKLSGENHNIKVSAGAAANVQENKSQLNMANETEETSLEPQNIKDLAGGDVRKQTVIKTEAPLADKQTSSPANEAQKNIGKVAATLSESAGLIDKVKPDHNSKTTPVEKNADMNSINTTTISGGSSTKTEISDVAPAQIINRVAAAFNETMANDGGRIKITLAPPSLGTLEMDVMVRNGTVKVMLTADNQDVQKMLSGNLDTLKASLQSQGLTIERCDVMMQDRREQYSQGFHQQAFNQEQSAGQHDERGETYHPETKTVNPLITRPGHPFIGRSGNISIFA